MTTITMTPRGPFSLTASTRFLEGFAPASYRGSGSAADDRPQPLRLAFPVEGSWRTTAVSVTQRPDGTVAAEVTGQAPDGWAEQLVRILSLDVDGSGLADVAERDPVVGELTAHYPGLRPVCFHSPYEAACWAVIGHRIRIVQAAAIKDRIAAAHGKHVTVDGVPLSAFPGPQALLDGLDAIKLPDIKIDRLRGLAEATLDGLLDAARLRALNPAAAIAELQQLPGIGPFSAELILVRGAGAPDVFPTSERRLHDSMVQLYELRETGVDALRTVAAAWSPYRSWVSVLIRTNREATTGEISSAGRRTA